MLFYTFNSNYLRKKSFLVPRHTRYFCTPYFVIAIKRYFDFCQLVSIDQPVTKVSSYQNTTQGMLCFDKSLPWLGIEIYVSNISISFYRNIVCKNVLCGVVLIQYIFLNSSSHKYPWRVSSEVSIDIYE